MLGIESVASYIPIQRIDNRLVAAEFGFDKDFLDSKIGIRTRAIKSDSEDCSDMAYSALLALQNKAELNLKSIQILVVVTQNPDANIPHVSAIVHGLANLSETCMVFDVSLGCSGYVYGLSIITSMMSAHGLTVGVLITSDPYSKIIDRTDRDSVLLFGDAATATLVSNRPLFVPKGYSFGTKGLDWTAIKIDNHHFKMDGRRVFNLIATVIPDHIIQFLADQRLEIGHVDRFVLHQGSKFIVATIAKRLKQPVGKVPFAIESYGNTVSSSIPLILEGLLDDRDAKVMVLCGFGVGLSWASCLCERL